MTKQDWNINKVTKEEIAQHLIEHHSVDFNDRRALTVEDFMEEHFPHLIRDMEDEGYGFLSNKGREKIRKVRKILSEVLKHCEVKGIAIAKVMDWDEKAEAEWRICKPTAQQLEYLKFKRWFTGAEGFFNKAVMQEKMISLPDLEVMMQELKDKIIERQQNRALVQAKRDKRNAKKEQKEQDAEEIVEEVENEY